MDVCDPECPVARASDVLSGKWTSLIVRDLLSGRKRYSELQRSLAGISPRMLAMRLQMLEEQGLVEKTTYPTVPPKTEYELRRDKQGESVASIKMRMPQAWNAGRA